MPFLFPVWVFFWLGSVWAQESYNQIPDELKDAGIIEHLGKPVTLSLEFQDEDGKKVQLGDFFQKKVPVLLSLVYYECPNLCGFMLSGLLQSLKGFDWTPGKNFEIVTLSINPKEKPDLALRKKQAYLKDYGRPEAAQGWHFLTGEEPQIRQLAGEVGYGYRYDPVEKQYAHSAAIFILTPEGKISRYLYGIDYPKKDLRLSLLEASHGKIGTFMDRFLLFCFRYDPHTRKYSVYVMNLMQAACALTILGLGGYLMAFWRKERKRT